MTIDFDRILKAAEEGLPDLGRFLRDIIAIPSPSSQEGPVIERIGAEMERLGFDRVETDPMGNLLGTIGSGKHLIAIDGHVDTVDVGDPGQWEFDPFKGYEDDETIGGRGASDQKGGVAAMVHAGGLIKRLGLEDDYTLVVTATVQEEDCDGLCWDYLVKERGLRPEFVVITEPTNGNICRGHRGRLEAKITTQGISAHGSAPERGVNAIYKMAPIINELEQLNNTLAPQDTLGKGSLTVSEVFTRSPSRCAVADGCTVSVDRRLTSGETAESTLAEIRELPAARKAEAQVELYKYAQPSYKGLTYPGDAYFPTWLIAEDHPATQTLVAAHRGLLGRETEVTHWVFSTNAVSIMGRYNIPAVGFGPGREDQAHAPNEHTWKQDLVTAAALYAALPLLYVKEFAGSMPKTTPNLAG
ncbi:MAG: YgeY family selenium metabolism-linked hydrolase [Candidatus Marinimicrobia bacterium]|nr:YgeY family selenium metabolism-linked hydrolase [Candidatus Neomarinimicrobiota bacterium]